MSTQNTAPATSTGSATEGATETAVAAGRIQQVRRYLMCRPEHFIVSYRINPWMEPANPTDTALAVRQWQALYDTYVALGHEVHLIDLVHGTERVEDPVDHRPAAHGQQALRKIVRQRL